MSKISIIEKVQECISSIFSKEDVVRLLNQQIVLCESNVPSKESASERKYTEADLKKILNNIKSEIRNLDSSEICSEDNVELELYGNEIRMEIDVDFDPIIEAVDSAYEEALDEINQALEEEESEESEIE